MAHQIGLASDFESCPQVRDVQATGPIVEIVHLQERMLDLVDPQGVRELLLAPAGFLGPSEFRQDRVFRRRDLQRESPRNFQPLTREA